MDTPRVTRAAPSPGVRELKAVETLERLGKYHLLSSIGQGGMGSVYRARLDGPAQASKKVALKLIHPHLNQERDFVQMFVNEMRVAMALAHRNIVQTFDAGQDDDRYYLVMELVEGASLRLLLNRVRELRRPMPLPIALFVASEVCAALEYAHALRAEVSGQRTSVIHRDVSPSNILLSEQGDVKLTDFGVARAAGRLGTSVAHLIKGKLAYMAPEQAHGQVDARGDLFSLGAVLYEMVCGEPMRREVDLASVRLGAPAAPPRRVRPELSASLETLILRCVATDPAQRPASAAELRRELSREAVHLQLARGELPDLHGELSRFLVEVGLVGPPPEDSVVREPAPATGPRPANLARALLAQAEELSAAVGSLSCSSESGTDDHHAPSLPHAVGATGMIPNPDVAPRPRRARARWPLVASLVLLGAAGAALLLARWLERRDAPVTTESPEPPATAPKAASNLAPAAAAPKVAAHDAAANDAPAAAMKVPANDAPADDAPKERVDRPAVTPHLPKRSATASATTARARLDVNAVPWAQVYVDGQLRGETPIQGLLLPAGRHRVRLVNPKLNLSSSFTVQLRPGELTRKVVRLE
ncbi:MAG: serine/threonine protein kinase [Deltaproteobacteria bacterium]|nr:serine/threonine protein kinase [Deltaproteobacteria bacterium]